MEDQIKQVNPQDVEDASALTDDELRGHKFFGASTAHGDGTFYDSDGYRYGVDAGMLGIVPIALVELEGESIEDIEKYKLGRIHEFKEDFEVGVNE